MTTCCLCSNLSSAASPEAWDKPIFESDNFVALPSLGSLVEGWLLLVPKKHYISMGALPLSLVAEMKEMKARVALCVKAQYGEVCVFEHGPAVASRKVGCSVDHAHLHIVPAGFDIGKAARRFMPSDAEWVEATWTECREAHRTAKDYLYLEQPLGRGRIATHSDFGSQVFRKVIASEIGRFDDFNWREHLELETVTKTISVLSSKFAGAAYSNEVIARER
jgi:ATP adenylyltransferase